MAARETESRGRRRLALAGTLCAAALALAPWLSAGTAQAVVAKIGGHTYGVTPVKGVDPLAIPGASAPPRLAPRNHDGLPSGGGPLIKHSGPVMHSVTTHVIYWDPNGEFTATTKALVSKFFTDVAHDSELGTNVFAVAAQYTDASGSAAYKSTFGGESVDKTAYPASGCTIPVEAFADVGPPYTSCLTDTQLTERLTAFVAAEKLPHGLTHQYFVLLPHKVVTCLEVGSCSNNEFCAYHSVVNEGTENELIYSDIPFSLLDTSFVKGCQDDGNEGLLQHPNGDTAGTNSSTRFGDAALKYTSHEYIEASTDPHLNNWFDSHGLEIGDKCNGIHGSASGIGWDLKSFLPILGGTPLTGTLFNQSINGDSYYLQSEWDNAAKACTMKPIGPTSAAFTPSPASPLVGTPVGFLGSALDPYGPFSFSWAFGDGASGSGPSTSHTYAAAGSYEVTMTVTDELFGSTSSVTHTLLVSSQSPPPPPPPPVPPPSPPPTPAQAPTAAEAAGVGPGGLGTLAPSSGFTLAEAAFNQSTGAITLSQPVGNPGTFSWLLTFQNGKFGAFAASKQKCKSGQVRLAGRCLPSKVIFARGSQTVTGPGTLKLRLKPSASALKALKNALKQKRGLNVTETLTFKSSLGGSPVSRTRSLTVKLKG